MESTIMIQIAFAFEGVTNLFTRYLLVLKKNQFTTLFEGSQTLQSHA